MAIELPTLTVDNGSCTLSGNEGQQVRFLRYDYRRLSSKGNIRLLKKRGQYSIWPGASPMWVFELIEYNLGSADIRDLDVSKSPYVAMSYCWGPQVFNAPLLMAMEEKLYILPVTAGAEQAIRLTLPAISMDGRDFWIDQVCINQADVSEKESQVKLMGEIYRRCWHCMIWLGPAGDNTQAAYTLLARLHEIFNHKKRLPFEFTEREVLDRSHTQIRALATSQLGFDCLPPADDLGWVEIAKLLQRDWFNRLWTFQEAVLCYTGDASFRCGIYNIAFKTFARASMFLGHQWTTDGVNFDGADFSAARMRLAEIGEFRDYVRTHRPTPLMWLLGNNIGRNCVNPRDRVYAFLGLQKEDGPHVSIEIDYRRSPQELYIAVTRKIIQAQRGLRICAEASERLSDNGLDGLPSWVPDLTTNLLVQPFELANPYNPYFKASGGRVHDDIEKREGILTVQGGMVDRITGFIDVEMPHTLNDDGKCYVLVEEILPQVFAALRSYTTDKNDAKIAFQIVNTITLGGYTRHMNFRESGLPIYPWDKSTCNSMMQLVLQGRTSKALEPTNYSATWLQSLARQAGQCANRRFAFLKNNVLGLVPKLSAIDDQITILHGSSLPFVTRPANDGCIRLIGVCFVDGIMQGEKVSWEKGKEFNIC